MINIYVGNLPYSVKSDELRDTFEEFGDVDSAEVIFDRRTKRSRGYGFVEMVNKEAGLRAIEELNGADYQGRELRVDESQPREEKPQRQQQREGSRRNDRRRSDDRAHESAGGLMGFVKKIFG